MLNQQLSLTPHQRQVIADLGVDAWYLKPLSRAELDSDYRTSQQEITHIIEELLPHEIEAQEYIQATPTTPIPPAIPTPIADSNTNNGTDKNTDSNHHNKQQTPKKIQVASSAFEPIRLVNADTDLTPPKAATIQFPEYNAPTVSPTLSAIQTAIDELKNNDIGVDSTKVLLGQGSQKPKWLIVIPPPTSQHIELEKLFNDSEQQLFNEVLSAIGKTQAEIYVTPLLKQAVYKQQDPNQALLEKHLPVLQAEITAHQPERIFIMGRVPNHAILSTKAPLSQLMNENYRLQIDDKTYPLTVLPSLHYFLAIPAEKKLLWQRLKQLM
ncbi:MAG: hypothetical protein KGV56_02250 [Gammaproteobacteria bacterium]|nr:hypothetical protein [Gammaproteobacteria bacterium]